ncbi:sensor histidine kinase [Actinomadura sp. HBU206391]|uniref:sensor histidine kinase n=1 Tax=Actinomadura sp. HBU206391 TaxID=2731692 RepID=UPI00164F80AC|nr:HAMP domain-containing sensor histidine kinase [Actinomadura sp. HBU206391]MBC6462562.1 HAMP domain-containing histidine kinase [Actinomadura sp. HBU206391]
MIRFRSGGLRVRLVAAFTGVAVFSSLVASGIAYQLIRRAMLQRTQDYQLAEVKNTLSRQVPVTVPPTAYLTQRVMERLTAPGREVYVFDVPPGTSLASLVEENSRLALYVTESFVGRADGGTVFRRIVHRGVPKLVIGARVWSDGSEPSPIIAFVVVDLSREAADLQALARTVAAADAVVVILAVGIALAAARGVLRPVRLLGRAARRLGEGRLDTRVTVTGRDELAALARTFNATASALEATVAELRSMEAASRRFAADVSHELRTPLTAMTAVVDVLSAEATGSADGGTAALLVADQIRRLHALVEDLLEISRLDAGTASLVLDDVLVAEAVCGSLSARGWTDAVVPAVPAELTARVDPRRLDVVIANLVGNAIEHGAPPVQVHVEPRDEDGVPGFVLTVGDQGPGVPEDLLPVAFDRFVKGDASRGRGGSGLGLSIARANAELHGGTLCAANAPEAGAVFTLWLPLAREEE